MVLPKMGLKISLETVELFQEKYRAHIEESDKNYIKREIMRFDDWLDNGGNFPINYQVNYDHMTAIHLTKEDFAKLLDDLYHQSNYITQLEFESRKYREMLHQLHDEVRAREQNTSVRLAYDKYQMLLKLVK